jgi:hypothetical protein
MSNIKKGSKLTVSTDYGISRDTSNNLGVLEVSGPAMSDVANVYGTNPAHFVIGGTDVSGILQLGINNDGNTFIDANTNNNHKDIIMQKYGGNVVVGTGAGSTAKVGIQTNTPLSTFHINSTDGLIIPVGTAGERPDPAYNGMIRYNTSTSQFEGYGPGSAWGSLGGVKDVDGDTYILAESSAGADNDALQFFTGGSERVVIDSSGYVGIGTSTPQTELDISGYITANTEEYAYDISFNNNASSDNWILFNSSYGNAGDVPVNTDWTIEYKHKITFGPSAAGDGHFGVVLEEDDISSNSYSTNTHFMYWQTDPSTNLTFRYQPADGTVVNELIPGTGYRWSLFSDHVNVKLEFLTKNNTIRLYFNGENVKTISNISNPSKIFGRWGFVEYNDNTHNIINPRITYGGKTYHLTTQHSTSTTAPTLTTTTKNVELINSNNNQINIPKLHSTELYADKMFVGRNNFNDYTFNAERKIVASDGAATDYFGYSVAIDGNYAIVGAREDDDKGTNSGSAYIFNVSTGAQLHKLVPSDGAAYDQFGWSVAISGNYAIVGAWLDDDNGTDSGSAYIYNVTAGAQLHKLIASDGAATDYFGVSVAISGNYAIVGANQDDDNGSSSGSAYIFNVSTGAQLHKLIASDGAAGDNFGRSVAISGNYAIVGAYTDDDKGSNSGSVYIYNVTTGAELHKLVAEDGAAGDYFGYSVAIDGNYAIVGAYQDGDNGSYSGSAYIFGPSSPSLLSIDNDSGNVNIMGENVGIGTTNPQAKLHVHDGYLLISENTDSRENCGGVIGFYSTDMGITATGANFSTKVQAYIGTRTHTYAGTSDAGIDRSEMVFYVGNNANSYGPDRFNFIGTQYMFHVKDVVPNTQDGKQALDYVAGQVSDSDCALFINTNKRVGIGTTSPNYPLHIYGSTNSGTIGNVSYIEYPNLSTAYASNHDVGLRVEKDIWTGQYVLASSDRRIKENIVDVSDNQALSMLRDIPCRYYEYKDKINRGTDKTIGFIAQEVREILPMAVSLQTNVIPNEMRVLTDISWNDTTLYTDLSDCSGIKYRFYVSNDISSNDETMNEVVGNSDNSFTFDQSYNNVFVYGKEVDDFHTVDKNKLFALNFSATQEIDRIQQQQIIDISNANTTIQQQATTIQEQATTIQQQATTIQTLETQIADILTRLSNLENTGSA